jgi:hypothetical protein
MSKHSVRKARVGKIHLLAEVNAKSYQRMKIMRVGERPIELFNRMGVGDGAFMPGYTANDRDPDTRLKLIKMGGYTRKGQLVWSIRSTQRRGVKGVAVYREA